MTAWALIGNYAYNGTSDGYSHFFNWFFVVRDPFYAIPESIATFIMPFLNMIIFFAVEIIIHIVIWIIQRRKSLKLVWVRILVEVPQKYLFRSLLTKNTENCVLGLFLSKPQAWHIITARSAVHIISPCGAVYHHAPACIYLRLDDIQHFVLMIYRPSVWWYTRLRRDLERSAARKFPQTPCNLPDFMIY